MVFGVSNAKYLAFDTLDGSALRALVLDVPNAILAQKRAKNDLH